MKISLLIVSRNEIEGMRTVLPRICRDWVDEIVIIDGASTDGSAEYARSLGFRVITQRNFKPTGAVPRFFSTHASGVVEAIKEGLEAVSGDYVITFTPDNNCVPERIPELVAKIREGGYDMIVVSRYLAPARSLDDTLWTAIGNRAITWLVNGLYGSRYTDVMVIFRAYRRDLIRELGIEIQLSLHTDLSMRCAIHGKRVAEISGDEPPRLGGRSIRHNVKNGVIELAAILSEYGRSRRALRKLRS